MGQWVILVIGLIVLFSYLSYQYQNSRNRDRFRKSYYFKSYFYGFAILIIGTLLVYLFFPEEGLGNEFFIVKLPDEVINYLAFSDLLSLISSRLNILGLLYAVLIFFLWFFYIRKLDFFKKEKSSYSILVVLLSCIFTLSVFYFSDYFDQYILSNSYQNDFWGSLLFYVLNVGFLEECVKLAPLLILYVLSNEIDEPFDFIYYACLSALGFGFLENLLYFQNAVGSVLLGRAMLAAAGHMIDASIIAYGFAVARFYSKTNKDRFLSTLKFFALGVLFHGLYDWLLHVQLLLVFMLFFVLSLQYWMIIINNCLNNSPFFSYLINYKNDRLKFRLVLAISIMSIVSLIMNSILDGNINAIKTFSSDLFLMGPIMVLYASTLSSFDLYRGYWKKFKLSFKGNYTNKVRVKYAGFFLNFLTNNSIKPVNIVGERIKLHRPKRNMYMMSYFTSGTATVVDRIGLIRKNGEFDHNWFVVLHDDKLMVSEQYEKNLCLIRYDLRRKKLWHQAHITTYMKLIPKGALAKKDRRAAYFDNLGKVVLNGADFNY